MARGANHGYLNLYVATSQRLQLNYKLLKSTVRFVHSSITEENFWRNYFYRLSLICQANEADAAAASRQPSADDSQGTYHDFTSRPNILLSH